MQITNSNHLPEPLVRAVTPKRHREPSRISVTDLILPPQIRALSVRYESQLSEDASDRLWALLGTLLHGVLERNAQGLKDTITEEALEMAVHGWTVVGHYDLSEMVLDGETLTDWKLTSVWVTIDGVKPEWEQQLNCYAELIRQAGRYVRALQIVTIFRDWSKNKARFDSEYPQQQVRVYEVPLWTAERAQQFITERVRLHQEAEQGSWPDCTPSERWEKPTTFALMKEGRKSAIRVMENGLDLMKYAIENGMTGPDHVIKSPFFIKERQGESTRCESYCGVSAFCPQFARMKQ